VKILVGQFRAGTIELTRLTLLQQNLVQLQDTLAQAQGEIALGLIQAYKALGGGWQIRLTGCEPCMVPQPGQAPPATAPAPGDPLPNPRKADAPAPKGPLLNPPKAEGPILNAPIPIRIGN
jgi:hypothetical protein